MYKLFNSKSRKKMESSSIHFPCLRIHLIVEPKDSIGGVAKMVA